MTGFVIANEVKQSMFLEVPLSIILWGCNDIWNPKNWTWYVKDNHFWL